MHPMNLPTAKIYETRIHTKARRSRTKVTKKGSNSTVHEKKAAESKSHIESKKCAKNGAELMCKLHKRRCKKDLVDPFDVIGGKPALPSFGVCSFPPATVILLQNRYDLTCNVTTKVAAPMRAAHLVNNKRQLGRFLRFIVELNLQHEWEEGHKRIVAYAFTRARIMSCGISYLGLE
jgi:hypothetical protein